MARYYQRPIVEAVQWTGSNYDEIRELVDGRFDSINFDGRLRFIELWSGGRSWYAKPGDWFVRDDLRIRVYSDAAFHEQHELTPAVVPAGQHETEEL